MATLNIKTIDQIRDSYLQTYRAELIRRGITNPNVSFGTEVYIKAQALAQQIFIAMNNTVIQGEALMPDAAQDGDLERIAALYGLSLRPAGGSVGIIKLDTTVISTQTILIAAGTQLQDKAGLLYQVVTTGLYKQDDPISVAAIDTGSATNLAVGDVLRWSTIPPFAEPTCTAGEDFSGGVEAETLEGLRARLLSKLSVPPGGGNWSQIKETADNSSPSVTSFVYPACNGPATCGVAIASAPTDIYKGRDFQTETTILETLVKPAVIGNYPEFVDFIITNCQNAPMDVSIGLSLPAAKTSSIPGNGSGWIDATPFPQPSSPTTNGCVVDTVTSDKIFTVDSTVASLPATVTTIVNVCWISKNDWILRTAKAFITGGSSPYTVTIQDPVGFTDTTGATIQSGDWIFPSALNTSLYIARLFEQFANLGPGEKIDPDTVSGLFPRAFRRPLPQNANPYNLGPSVLKFIVESGPEVFDVQYLFRGDLGAGNGICPIPTSVQYGPYVITPQNIGFYPIP